jgi:hypothetical protein
LKDDLGKMVDTLAIDMYTDSIKNTCLHISDPEKQQAWIDTILTKNVHISVSYNPYDSCIVLTPAISFQGSDTMKLILCDNGNPALCDTFALIANVSKANSINKVDLGNSMKVFPNPFSGNLNFQLRDSEGIQKSVIIYDITGKACLNQKFTSSNGIISTSHLRQGLYLVQIFSGNILIGSQKLLKIE